MKRIGLAWQILIGLALGIAVGAIFFDNPAVVKYLQPIGDIFIRLIKMIVVPIVVASIVVGVAGVGDVKKLGRLGGKTIIYFEIITTIAIIVGLLIANIFQPGKGVNMEQLTKTDISKYTHTTEQVQSHSFADTFVNIVPTNIMKSLADGDMLAIIFFSVLFGLGVAAIGERGRPVLQFFQGVADAMFYVTNQVMKFAPFGVFALIGVTVSTFGLASLIPLGKLLIVVYGAMIFFVVVVLGLTAKIFGINIFQFFKILKDELILAYSTASSETVLPKIMEKMEKFGCPKAITSFVIPTGYSFNLDGSTLYQAIAAIFLAQMYGIDLSITEQITLLLVLMVTSKGIAGIDRILDMARTAVNVVGNSLAAVVMSKWEGQYDAEKGQAYLKEISNKQAA